MHHAVLADAQAMDQRQQEGEPAVPRYRPAVVTERGAVDTYAAHPLGMLCCKFEREDRTHRQAGYEQMIDFVTEFLRRRFHAGVPIFPAGGE